MTTPTPAYRELLDLLTSSPTPEQILGYVPTASTLERVNYLRARLEAGTLGVREKAELNALMDVITYKRMLNRQAQKPA